MRKTGQVGIVFFEDGAANRGTFHEAANMAAIWKLPVIFVCENNLYASTMPAGYSLAGGSIAGRASAYGIPGYVSNGNDILEVRKTVAKAVKQAREGQGPSIVENKTYRYRGHFEGDPQKYRTTEEIEDFQREHDPIQLFKAVLTTEGIIDDNQDAELRDEVANTIEEAVRYAQDQPLPKPEEALEDLYVNPW
jgi:pyruvate dehydrogenase E1 component alpha subunit